MPYCQGWRLIFGIASFKVPTSLLVFNMCNGNKGWPLMSTCLLSIGIHRFLRWELTHWASPAWCPSCQRWLLVSTNDWELTGLAPTCVSYSQWSHDQLDLPTPLGRENRVKGMPVLDYKGLTRFKFFFLFFWPLNSLCFFVHIFCSSPKI